MQNCAGSLDFAVEGVVGCNEQTSCCLRKGKETGIVNRDGKPESQFYAFPHQLHIRIIWQSGSRIPSGGTKEQTVTALFRVCNNKYRSLPGKNNKLVILKGFCLPWKGSEYKNETLKPFQGK